MRSNHIIFLFFRINEKSELLFLCFLEYVHKLNIEDKEQVDGIMIHICQRCGKGYKRRKTLFSHLRYECSKTAENKCHLCAYKTKRKSNLKRHLGRHLAGNIQTLN